MRKYSGELHIGVQAETLEKPKSKEDCFFGKFENTELKQEASIETPATLIEAKPSTTAEKSKTNENVDKLTVQLEATSLKPATKINKVISIVSCKTIFHNDYNNSWVRNRRKKALLEV